VTSEVVEWSQQRGGWSAVARDWDALAERQLSPFLKTDWLAPWCESFLGAPPVLCLVWRGESLAAGAAFSSRRGALRNLANDHMPMASVLAVDDAALTTLTSAVMRRRLLTLRFDLLLADDPAVTAIRREAANAGKALVVRSRNASPTVETTMTTTEYRERTRPNWGAPLDRFRRKIVRDHGASFRLLEQPDDLEEVLRRGFDVEASGWKGRAGTAVLSSQQTTDFYLSVARRFAARSALRLSWIDVGGRMIAFDLCIEHDKRLFLIKTGFDEDFRSYAPGLLLRLAVIEACLEGDIRSHELLGGEDAWKAKFATLNRPRIEIAALNTQLHAIALDGYYRHLHVPLGRAYTIARQLKRPTLSRR
jgi:CelD/BcsL family acetyltransferase involved in cellulose biosynthesis